MTSQNKKNYREEIRSLVARRWGYKRELAIQEHIENLGLMKIVYILIVPVVI